MKNFRQISFLLVLIILFLISCTMEKRVYLSGYNVEWENTKTLMNKIDDNKNNFSSIVQNEDNLLANDNIDLDENTTASVNNTILSNSSSYTLPVKISAYTSKENNQSISTHNGIGKDSCDHIFLRNGDEIVAKVENFIEDKINYRECDYKSEHLYSLKKSKVYMIKYANGTENLFDKKGNQYTGTKTDSANIDKKPEGFGIASCMLGLLVIPAFLYNISYTFILFVLFSIIFGFISLSIFRSNPYKYKWKVFGFLGIILGLIPIIISVIFVIAMNNS